MRLKKVFIPTLIIFAFIFSTVSAFAAESPVIYKDTITVTEKGGKFQIGFITLEFKKDFLEPERLPATFDVEIYAMNGIGYIEVSPDTADFLKKVHIRVDAYDGLLFDKALGHNIEMHVKKQHFWVDHFSMYAWNR